MGSVNEAGETRLDRAYRRARDGALAQGSAAAATLKADYQFQDNFGSSVPGVGDIGPVGDGHKFVTETVGCTPTRVLTFPKGSGAQLNSPATVDNYSVVVLFRLTDLSGYRRILAPGSAGAYLTDNGLYERDGKLAIYDAGPALGANTVFAGNTYAEVAFTYVYSIPPNETVGYVNGVRQAGFTSGTNQFADYMRFFKDNDSGGVLNEDSGGAVARIRIYDGFLTAVEVAAIHAAGLIVGACDPAKRATAAVNGKVKVKRGRHGRLVVLTGIDAGCPVGLGTCTGTAAVQRTGGSKRLASVSKLPKRLGKKRLSVAAGKTQAVKVKLIKKASDALRDKGKIKVNISVKLSPPGGAAAVASRTAKLKPPG